MARFALVCVVLIACTMATEVAKAQPDPSFDCRRASSPVERLICSDPYLAKSDRDVATAYRKALTKWNATPHRVALIRTQTDWLQKREQACGVDDEKGPLPSGHDRQWMWDCLRVLYGHRTDWLLDLAEMDVMPGAISARSPAADQNFSGRYVAGGDGWYGQMQLRRGNGDWTAVIVSATGLTSHVCGLDGRLAAVGGAIVLHAYLDADARRPEALCRVTLMSSPGGFAVEPEATDSCRAFCGARGNFAGSYYRTGRMPK